MKVEVAVLDSPSLISLMVSVDIKQHSTNQESLRSCVKVEVAILDRQRQRDRDRVTHTQSEHRFPAPSSKGRMS